MHIYRAGSKHIGLGHRMARKVVEKLHKEPGEYEIDFIIGIDDNPSEANNAMFYIRMESIRKKNNKQDRAREIWLSCEEMDRLSMLMSMSSKFWKNHTLAKNTPKTRKTITEFIRKLKLTRDFLF